MGLANFTRTLARRCDIIFYPMTAGLQMKKYIVLSLDWYEYGLMIEMKHKVIIRWIIIRKRIGFEKQTKKQKKSAKKNKKERTVYHSIKQMLHKNTSYFYLFEIRDFWLLAKKDRALIIIIPLCHPLILSKLNNKSYWT